MQPTPPGWYWDPNNQPDLFRWWDGRTWREAVTPDRNAAPPYPPELPTPVEGRYVAGGLSVPVLPEPWEPCPPYPEQIGDVAGQALQVGRTPRGPYLAAVFVGTVPAEGASHTLADGDLASTAQALARRLLETYYPHEHPHDGLHATSADVDGHPACRVTAMLDIEDPTLDFAREGFAVLVVAQEKEQVQEQARPGVVYASLPEVRHVPLAEDLLAQVHAA